MTFEDKLAEQVRNKILSEIKENNFLRLQYSDRLPIPEHIMTSLWDSVDWDEVIKTVKGNLETQICNAIVGSMASEVKTDVKKLLSVDGVRQKLRMEVYPNMMSVLNADE